MYDYSAAVTYTIKIELIKLKKKKREAEFKVNQLLVLMSNI